MVILFLVRNKKRSQYTRVFVCYLRAFFIVLTSLVEQAVDALVTIPSVSINQLIFQTDSE